MGKLFNGMIVATFVCLALQVVMSTAQLSDELKTCIIGKVEAGDIHGFCESIVEDFNDRSGEFEDVQNCVAIVRKTDGKPKDCKNDALFYKIAQNFRCTQKYINARKSCTVTLPVLTTTPELTQDELKACITKKVEAEDIHGFCESIVEDFNDRSGEFEDVQKCVAIVRKTDGKPKDCKTDDLFYEIAQNFRCTQKYIKARKSCTASP
ncbi:uncharacterized protein LOC141658529 [Silene latifolia]|uniref:uncharacterized protein LOC141658529 n=1 Tax=Silene latifolia TaxID=37657 RepID=UPI003D775A41